jgi:hypothetical protein
MGKRFSLGFNAVNFLTSLEWLEGKWNWGTGEKEVAIIPLS